MNELVEFLTSEEIIVVYIVAAIACFLCFIIYIVEKTYYKRKRKHNTRELNKLVEEVNKELAKEDLIEEETIKKMNKFDSLIETMDNEYQEEEEEDENSLFSQIDREVTEQIEVEPVKEVIEEVETIEEELPLTKEIINNMSIDSDEELTYTSIEPTKEEATQELKRLTEELEKMERLEKESEEEEVMDITRYEEQQEENAIISLEELIKKSKEMYASNEVTQYKDEGNEPISLKDLEIKLKEYSIDEPTTVEKVIDEIESLDQEEEPVIIEQQKLVLDDFNTVKPQEVKEVKEERKVFKPSPVISPIYGIRKETPSDIELENTANYDKLDKEIKKTNDFLVTLKELQSHLD